ncbi:MAG: alpha/beta hydrolase-fold protein [Anaerolineae bacterium]|nr:alpha/beta hydrolase-fold protein [Anaerolineae bacterium]
MHREHHRWYSPSLQRHMDLLVFGHGGSKVLVFPTSKGKFYEWEDRGVWNHLSDWINAGYFQFYCVDSVDTESWYNWGAHPGHRAWRQTQYDQYLYHEVLPLMWSKNQHPYTIAMGASFGAYHAMNFGLKHPDAVNRILAMSGIFDIAYWAGGYTGEHVYLNNPTWFIPGERDPQRIRLMQRQNIVIAVGKDDPLLERSRQMSRVLWDKGVGNALREWDGWCHDWPYWERMLRAYLGGA